MFGTIWRKLRNWLLAGLVVLVPVWLAFFTVYWLFDSLDGAVTGPLQPYLPENPLPGLGVLLVVVITLLVGWLTTHLLGQKLLDVGERVMLRLPIIRAVYTAAKQVMEAVISPKERAFSRVALLEYPRPGLYALAFVAGELPGTDMVRVWMAPGPSPSGGPVLLVPMDQLVVLPMTVEDGLKLIISAGVLVPKESDIAALAEATMELRRRRGQL